MAQHGHQRHYVRAAGHQQQRSGNAIDRPHKVAAVTEGHHKLGFGLELHVFQQGIEADTPPLGVKFRPFCNAVNVGVKALLRQGIKLVPTLLRRLFHQSFEPKLPVDQRNSRRGAGREHREIGRFVLAGRQLVRPIGRPLSVKAFVNNWHNEKVGVEGI